MQAIVIDRFGGPEVMRLREIAQPLPADDEVLIRIDYAGVNPVDWKIREGLMAHLFEHRFPLTLGWDASGVIAQAGCQVPTGRIGERVLAYCRQYGKAVEHGTYAGFIALPAAMAITAPDCLSAAQAAAVPLPALTAWQGLFDAGQLQSGETVLILGGAGGVGSMALQLARQAGARVLTAASAVNHDYVATLGAHAAFDYRGESLQQAIERLAPGAVDLVFDCVGGSYLQQGLQVLPAGGRMVSIAGVPDERIAAERGVRACRIVATANPVQLREVARRLAARTLVAPPVHEMNLADVAEAHGLSKDGHVRGKIVLRVNK